MSKFPRKKAEWVGKALVICLVLWIFSAMGIVAMQTPVLAHASKQNQADAPDIPIPTSIVPPLPTLQPVSTLALDPLPSDTPVPTPTNTPESAAGTPASIPTPTHISTPTSRPTHETTSKAKAAQAPTQVSTPVPSSTQASLPDSTPTPAIQSTVQPTPSVQAVLPAANQLTSTVQPAYSKPTANVTDTASIATTATPAPSHQPASPTTQRDQGLFTTLIVTGSISATTLLAAGVVFGIQKQKIQIRKKRKQNEAESLPTAMPKQMPTPLTEMETQEIPIQRALLNGLRPIEEQDTESIAAIEKLEDTAPLPSLPQDLRTDPVLNAVRKQALMGIFVLLGQEKTENVATKEHKSEEHTT